MTVVRKSIRGGIVALAFAALAGCDSGGSSSSSGSATGMAVINGDFISAAVSLLGPDGKLVTDDCVDSGTGAGGTLSFPLSGDITLPSQPQLDGKLWIVDRQNVAVTIVDPK